MTISVDSAMQVQVSIALLLAFGAPRSGGQQFPIAEPSQRELQRVNYHRVTSPTYHSPAPEPGAEDTPLLSLMVRPDGARVNRARRWWAIISGSPATSEP